MSEDKVKRCAVCKCELPSGYKLPVCKYHRDVAKDNATKVGLGAVTVVGGVAVLVKTGNIEKAKSFVAEHLPR